MGKFQDDAAKLLEYVGGKENINAVTHCVTRMRFVLADPSKADIKKIESMIDDFFEFYLSLWNDDYLAEEKPKLENAERVTSGNFVMYVILDDDARAAAITAFENETK